MSPEEKQTALSKLASEIASCKKCRLHEQRTNTVPGVGNSDADVMFIGEGPGRDEDLQGEPFVGAAGKFLTQMIESLSWTRADVYIGNIIKCRPPENRDPEPDEVDTCWNYLEKQIEIIEPKLIVLLGRHSMNRFLPSFKISDAHGKPVRRKDGRVMLPLYHPAAALYSPSQKAVHMSDFAKIPKILEAIAELPAPPEPPATQEKLI